MMNTIISGAAGGLSGAPIKPLFFGMYKKGLNFDIMSLCNGILAGCVAVTGVASYCQPWAAFIIGLIAGVVYSAGARFCIFANVDDALEASAVHGFTGMWGLIACGLFHNTKGLFCGTVTGGERWKFFGVQLLGMIVIMVWTSLFSVIFFYVSKKLGLLRVSYTTEVLGLDIAQMDFDSIPHINELVLQYRIKEQAMQKLIDTDFGLDIEQRNPSTIRSADEPGTAAK